MRLEILDNKSMLLPHNLHIDYTINEVELSSLTQYVHIIHCLMQETGIDLQADSSRLFFRGQADAKWNVSPSIFRENQLSLEHKYVRSAISRLPLEFANSVSAFDRLTKLQHYGLPTRLLDITHNPMVALYFSCDKHESEEENDDEDPIKTESDGAVYIAYANPEMPESLNTQVIANLAAFDLERMQLQEFWNRIKENVIGLPIDDSEKKMLDHLQKYTRNHFVVSDLSNERIIRQSGTFLVCGCVNIDLSEDISSSLVSKAKSNLQSEFSFKIVIDADEKDAILDELDFYNINEATLFPELEHQLKYVAHSNKRFAKGIDDYRGVIKTELSYETLPNPSLDAQEFLRERAEAIVSQVIDKKAYADEITKIVLDHATIDWHTRNSIQAKLIAEIKRFYVKKQLLATAS